MSRASDEGPRMPSPGRGRRGPPGDPGGDATTDETWFDRHILPYVKESTLWPVLIVVLCHVAAFGAPLLLFGLRDRDLRALAAIAVVLVASGRAVAVDLKRRRVGAITALVGAAWLLSGVGAFFANRWQIL